MSDSDDWWKWIRPTRETAMDRSADADLTLLNSVLSGARFIREVPAQLGRVIRMSNKNGLITCQTESGIVFVVPVA